jgi:hypothetical protein
VPEETPPVEPHAARDRFGKAALRTVHDLTAGLAEASDGEAEPVVLRTGGPHRSIKGLAALLDEVLDDETPEPPAR